MRVIGRADRNGIDLLFDFVVHLPVIAELLCLGKPFGGSAEGVCVCVAEGDDIFAAYTTEAIAALTTGTDAGDIQFRVSVLRLCKSRSGKSGDQAGDTGNLEKITTFDLVCHAICPFR